MKNGVRESVLLILVLVMAGLVPAIHVFGQEAKEDMDARDEPGHDDGNPECPR
jgi:hypothetical protein